MLDCLPPRDFTVTRCAFVLLLTFATFVSAATAAYAAPRQLYGKSIIITWTEQRLQQHKGSFRLVSRNGTLSVYVSTEGHIFNRSTMAGGRHVNSRERVGSDGHTRISFAGRTLIVFQSGASSGARKIQVTFDQGFTSCNADIIRGKETGAATILGAHGAVIESIKTTAISCSLHDGNIFASG
jgi:hypothetical protein